MFRKFALAGAMALVCAATLLPMDAIAQVSAGAANIVAPAGATAAVPQSDGSVIFLRPLIDGLLPYIISTLGALIVAGGGWLIALWNRKSNLQISNDQKDRILAAFKNAAQTQAGVIFAKLDSAASTMSIDVGHPLIADAVNKVLARLPDEAVHIGMTPDKLADMVAGEIGKLQATATLVPPAAPAKV